MCEHINLYLIFYELYKKMSNVLLIIYQKCSKHLH